uniref:HTH psq-type domain-containing protein n=1 Tax=Globisporangium ultimum (strain ATCC 200006 / CBS 805.95 / DAOM BR144) TaxID=431595 RepID=K3X4Z0_GLOUD
MAAMTVLPSFQTFLQSTTRPLSPLSTTQFPSSATSAPSPLDQQDRFTPPFPAATLSPSLWKAASFASSRSSFSSFSSSDEDDGEYEYAHSDQFRLQHERARAENFVVRRRAGHSFASTVGLPSSPLSLEATAKRAKKKYLKERERCEIVRRVRAGEKQAHLAKEFGVSRAAVCYLLKHQMEILRRSAQRL